MTTKWKHEPKVPTFSRIGCWLVEALPEPMVAMVDRADVYIDYAMNATRQAETLRMMRFGVTEWRQPLGSVPKFRVVLREFDGALRFAWNRKAAALEGRGVTDRHEYRLQLGTDLLREVAWQLQQDRGHVVSAMYSHAFGVATGMTDIDWPSMYKAYLDEQQAVSASTEVMNIRRFRGAYGRRR